MEKSHNTSKQKLGIIYILIFSLVITTAKGLRFGGNIGPGELFSLAVALWYLMRYNGRISNNISKVTLFFWTSIIFILIVGMFVRTNFHNFPNPFPRTLIAYIFCFVISYGVLCSEILKKHIDQTNLIYIKITSIISIVFCILIFFNVRNFLGLNLYWLGTSRFQGWSLDPNQVAIPFIITPFLLLNHLKNALDHKWVKSAILLLLLSNIYVGISTDSDSLIAAWIIGLLVSLGFGLLSKIKEKKLLNIKSILLIVALITLFFLILIFNFQDGIQYIADFLTKDGQLSTRLNIWSASIDIIKKSPLVGLGPDIGRDLGGSIMGESHNNILHLGMSTGILGIALLLGYYYEILKSILRSKNMYFLGAFVSLFVFGLTHYTLRHPLYWFMLLLINGLANSEKLKEVSHE